jgi:hypothetical protein
MANEEHLKILLQGVEAWNEWREDNPNIMPALNNLDLSLLQFHGIDLRNTDLSNTYFFNTSFRRAKFNNADLSNADFGDADLSNADFNRANLSDACLQAARLINANLDGANLTDARLWETQRAGWSIKGVVCESIYWDEKAEKKSVYAEGEFEKLFADLTKIQLSYKDGMSLLEVATLPSLIQHLVNTFPDSSLRFVSICTDAGGAVVELAIEDIDDLGKEQIKQLQTALEKEAQQQIELQRKALKEREKRLELEGEVKQLSLVIDKLIQRPNFKIQKSKGDIKMSEDKGDIYNVSGQVGAVGPNSRAENITFTQNWNQLSGSIDLPKLAEELASLQAAMKEKATEPEQYVALAEISKAAKEAKEGNGSKVMEYLNAAGNWAWETANELGTTIAAEVLKKALGL